jgi:methyl-accepting chemotaxis protein
MKLSDLRITPKLGILVGMTLLGLCVAGVLAGYMMQWEMLNARIDQVKATVEMARNMAIGLQKQVDAGELTKEAAIAEFSRRAETLTYDKGNGYLFINTMDGIVVLLPGFKPGTDRLNVLTNGRAITRDLRDGVAAKGEVTLPYEFQKPGQSQLSRKVAYGLAIPGWNMFVGSGAYLDDLDTKLMPIIVTLGLATLAIGTIAGGIAWLIGRSISRPLGELGARMRSLADGALEEPIPGVGRGDEIGAMAATVQVV